MNKITFFLLLGAVSFSFAQQANNKIIQQKKSKHSLNMEIFILEDFITQNTNSLTEFLRESNSQGMKPLNNMPIFVPEGKFFLKIYEVEPDIDENINIFPLEKSNYFWKTVG